ncbi:unnamed protein product, partial [Ectocarpus sp. 8 AP-2014]
DTTHSLRGDGGTGRGTCPDVLTYMSHGGVSLSDVKDGGVLNLSATSTAGGDASISVAFDYTAESLACHDSPSGTCGFLYTAPSPSPTAPSCPVRLCADSGGRG